MARKKRTTTTRKKRTARQPAMTAKIRQFCLDNPGVTGRRVLHELQIPDTPGNLQKVYAQRNYIAKHGGFKPVEDKPSTKKMPIVTDPTTMDEFQEVFKICKSIGIAKVARIARAIQRLGIK